MFRTERWLVTGGRDFTDFRFLTDRLDELVKKRGRPDVLITGGQRTKNLGPGRFHGADHQAEEWARFHGIPLMIYPIGEEQWSKFGKAAGRLRNEAMKKLSAPSLVIAFKGKTGTANMVRLAEDARIEVIKFMKKEPTDANTKDQ